MAEACLEGGAFVIISSSNPGRVSKAVLKLQSSYPSAKARVSGLACNLADEANLESSLIELLNYASSDGSSPLDHIVYTAGDPIITTKLADIDIASIHRASVVRYCAPLLLAKLLTSTHIRPGPNSSFTFTSGSVSEKPLQDWTLVGGYASGLHGLGRQLALDLRPLRVNVVSPGAVSTDLWLDLPAEERQRMTSIYEAKMATGVIGQPEDVAEAYLYCMRDANVTGSLISSNGGGLIMP